ncbi:MAG: hypothetical protein SRB2_04892 [Desulfobacteraceae bacterium Eth-SRB2]|nr:MAG: hypothetical protein SRB2_04892 [Desulfobacteraceae bacterium Eth-SRB2]
MNLKQHYWLMKKSGSTGNGSLRAKNSQFYPKMGHSPDIKPDLPGKSISKTGFFQNQKTLLSPFASSRQNP